MKTSSTSAEREREITIEFLRLVNESTGTKDLVRAATAFFQQQSGCEAVGIRLREGEDYPYYETHGFPQEFVLAEKSLCARDSANCIIRDSSGSPIIECMCGNVICGRFNPAKRFFTERGSFWTNSTTELLASTTEADRQSRTRNRCNGEGYESVALLPLRIGDERLGLLQLNDRRKGVFTLETIKLWERLAVQLAVALSKFRAEETLRESEEKYRLLFESTQEVVILLDKEGNVVDINPRGEQQLGYPRSELIGMNVFENLVVPEDHPVERNLIQAASEGRTSTYEVRYRTKEGKIIHFEGVTVPRTSTQGEFLSTFCTLRDITERKRAEEAIQKSERKYKALFDSTLDGIYQVNAESMFILMNPAGARIFGYERPEEILGKNALEFWRDPKYRDAFREELKRKKKLSSYPMRARKKNGEPIELESSSIFIEDDKGTFLGIEGILRDVTARKRAEEEVQAAAQRWDNTFNAMNDAVSILDKDGNILQCNQPMLSLLKKLPGDIIGNPCWEVVYNEAEPTLDCPFTRMQKSRHRESMTVQLLTRWFSVTLDPILDHAGNLAGCVHIMSDITEQRRFEERIRESESKFRSLAEQSLVGAYIIQDGKFKYVNPRLAEMFAYPVEDIVDRKGPLDLVVPEDHHLVAENMKRRLSDETPSSHYEVRGRRRAGEIMHIEIFGSTTAYQGKPAIIGVVLDITEKKKLENQLLQAQKMEAVGQLTGGIAHDFNNILSAIIGYGSLLQMKMAGNDPLRSFVDQILAGADRAANLTRSLLTFSRKQIVNLMPVDVNVIIKRVETLVHSIIGEDIDFRTTLAPRGLIVNADAGQIEQVLVNLVTNARDAMPKGGILSIETGIVEPGEAFEKQSAVAKSGKYVLVSVSDTGIGMDEKTREKIFEPFFSTKDLGRGTGLGLSMVYGIIKQHGGQILCYSEPGKGTTFKVYLPLLSSGDEMATLKTSAAAPAEPARGTETVLVAEDDEAIRSLATTILENAGYTVIVAVDGEDAVRKFSQNKDRIRLILCDVIMPKKSGDEVREEIMKTSPAVKILFMSGYPADIIRQKSLLEEGAEIVMKPIPSAVLLTKVREVLDKK